MSPSRVTLEHGKPGGKVFQRDSGDRFGTALLTIDFYGENVSVLTDTKELASQICFNFDTMVMDGHFCDESAAADIRVTRDHIPEGAGSELLAYWSVFSEGLCRVLADRFVFLHASAIGAAPRGEARESLDAPPNGAIFIGPSGCGKTTLAIAAARLGHLMISDDVVALEWSSGLIHGVPFPFRPRFEEARASLEKITMTHRPPARKVALLKRAFLLADASGAQDREPTVVEHLVRATHCPYGEDRTKILARVLRAVKGCEFLWLPALPRGDRDLISRRALLSEKLREL